MDLNSTSSGTVQREDKKRYVVYNESQVATLQAWFQKNPYPGIRAREQLAKEVGVLEYNIQTWFGNYRRKQRRLKARYSVQKGQDQEHSKTQPCTQGTVQKINKKGIVYSKSQVATLQAWFQKNPYPDRAAREQLAKEIGVLEYNIETWFQTYRRKQRSLEFGSSLWKRHSEEQSGPQPCTQEYLPKEAGRLQIPTMRSQTSILGQASERNQIPDTAAREEPAKQITGTPEPGIQKCFLNGRYQHAEQSKRESINSLGDSPRGRPDLTLHQDQMDLSTLTSSSQRFLPQNSYLKKHAFLSALPPTYGSFIPWHPGGDCGSQEPGVMMVQSTQTVQGGENSDTLLTPGDHLTIPPALGSGISDTHTPFWPQCQGKCQDHSKHSDREVLQFKDSSQPEPDIPYIMRWWNEGRLALIAEWEPSQGTLEQAGHRDTVLWPSSSEAMSPA
ncbi:double homeobox protein B-like [Tamandua tetradactyla]|uniref:double homeobox protein B-like n=1 Tax=Tamandua tetradactyla TaxID=48850 RepID=UPI004053A220